MLVFVFVMQKYEKNDMVRQFGIFFLNDRYKSVWRWVGECDLNTKKAREDLRAGKG